MLLYETTDSRFADLAVSALLEADIPAYRVGNGYVEPYSGSHRGLPTESQVCIYIERDRDARQANEILIKLGAVADTPTRLPPLRYLIPLIIVIVALGVLIAEKWEAS